MPTPLNVYIFRDILEIPDILQLCVREKVIAIEKIVVKLIFDKQHQKRHVLKGTKKTYMTDNIGKEISWKRKYLAENLSSTLSHSLLFSILQTNLANISKLHQPMQILKKLEKMFGGNSLAVTLSHILLFCFREKIFSFTKYLTTNWENIWRKIRSWHSPPYPSLSSANKGKSLRAAPPSEAFLLIIMTLILQMCFETTRLYQ